MDDALVLCIGNDARGDDGVGHEVARLLRAQDVSAAVECATALDITWAESVSSVRALIVVDAERREAPAVRIEDITLPEGPARTHHLDSGRLVALAGSLYGNTPVAWLVSVAAPQMDHGQSLSSTASEAAAEAAEAVRRLLDEIG